MEWSTHATFVKRQNRRMDRILGREDKGGGSRALKFLLGFVCDYFAAGANSFFPRAVNPRLLALITGEFPAANYFPAPLLFFLVGIQRNDTLVGLLSV